MPVIFVFRARVQSMRFSSALTAYGFKPTVITTPRTLTLGCGLSVRVSDAAIKIAAELIRSLALNTFLGAFNELPTLPVSYERVYL